VLAQPLVLAHLEAGMWSSPEIEIVPLWENVWWDRQTDQEYVGVVTGTPWNPNPTENLEIRRIERIYGKPVHKGCGGDLQVARHDTCVDGFTLVCLRCHKEICANA
jgi:hypothetical protein